MLGGGGALNFVRERGWGGAHVPTPQNMVPQLMTKILCDGALLAISPSQRFKFDWILLH